MAGDTAMSISLVSNQKIWDAGMMEVEKKKALPMWTSTISVTLLLDECEREFQSRKNKSMSSVDERISGFFTPAVSARRIECRNAVRKSGSKAWSISA